MYIRDSFPICEMILTPYAAATVSCNTDDEWREWCETNQEICSQYWTEIDSVLSLENTGEISDYSVDEEPKFSPNFTWVGSMNESMVWNFGGGRNTWSERWACVVYPPDDDNSISALAPQHPIVWRMNPFKGCHLTTDIHIKIEVIPGMSDNHHFMIIDTSPLGLYEMHAKLFFTDKAHNIAIQGDPFLLTQTDEEVMLKNIVQSRLTWPAYKRNPEFIWNSEIFSTEHRVKMMYEIAKLKEEYTKWRDIARGLVRATQRYQKLSQQLEDVNFRRLWKNYQNFQRSAVSNPAPKKPKPPPNFPGFQQPEPSLVDIINEAMAIKASLPSFARLETVNEFGLPLNV